MALLSMLKFISAFLHAWIPQDPITAHEIGRFGEERAVDYLKRVKKYRIICRNWKYRHGEINIVAWDREVLVFLEVRARRKGALVPGYHSVGHHKKKVLRRTCRAYMQGLSSPPDTFRFDIVEMRHGEKEDYTINHFENVTLFSKYYRP